MDELSLDADTELSWETRLATIGRMLDRQSEPLPTLTITVMRRGIVLQRAPVATRSMTTALVHGAAIPLISSPSLMPATSVADQYIPRMPDDSPPPVATTTVSNVPGPVAITRLPLATRLGRWLQGGRSPVATSWMRHWL
jgi:hypothetical protein